MNRQIFNFAGVLMLFFSLTLVSCDKDADISSEEFAEKTIENFSIETRSEPGGCFDLVFPISIEYPDGNIQEYESIEELKEAIKTWKDNNEASFQNRPHLVYPIELMTQDGELVSLENRKELRSTVKECRKEMGYGGMKACFRLEFPVSVIFPDGSVQEFENRKEAKQALRQWKKENPDTTERPVLEFPVNITYKDGTVTEVASKEQLLEAKAECE